MSHFQKPQVKDAGALQPGGTEEPSPWLRCGPACLQKQLLNNFERWGTGESEHHSGGWLEAQPDHWACDSGKPAEFTSYWLPGHPRAQICLSTSQVPSPSRASSPETSRTHLSWPNKFPNGKWCLVHGPLGCTWATGKWRHMERHRKTYLAKEGQGESVYFLAMRSQSPTNL